MDKYAQDRNEIHSGDEPAPALILTVDSLANISTSKASRVKDHRAGRTAAQRLLPSPQTAACLGLALPSTSPGSALG